MTSRGLLLLLLSAVTAAVVFFYIQQKKQADRRQQKFAVDTYTATASLLQKILAKNTYDSTQEILAGEFLNAQFPNIKIINDPAISRTADTIRQQLSFYLSSLKLHEHVKSFNNYVSSRSSVNDDSSYRARGHQMGAAGFEIYNHVRETFNSLDQTLQQSSPIKAIRSYADTEESFMDSAYNSYYFHQPAPANLNEKDYSILISPLRQRLNEVNARLSSLMFGKQR